MSSVRFVILTLQAFICVCGFAEQVSSRQTGDPLEQQYGRLQHAAIIFRHGDRTPINSYPNDPYRNYPWQQGYGQLTDAGKRRLFHLGGWFKMRYRDLTGDEYDRNRIMVNSSGTDRSIMSAQSFLFGYYPANGSKLWYDKNERWQPIPVFTIPPSLDNLLLMQGSRCDRLQQLKETTTSNPNWSKVCTDYKELIEHISNYTGLNISCANPSKIHSKLRGLPSTLTIEKEHNLTLPEWTKDVYPDMLQAIINLLTDETNFNLEKMRLSAGPILKHIIDEMKQKVNNVNFTRTLHIYSGHDTTIKTIRRALRLSDFIPPPYAATLMFELRKNGSDNIVTLSYKNTTDKAYLMEIPGCGLACTLEEFINVTKDLIPEDWEKECKQVTNLSTTVTGSNYYLILMAIIYTFLK